MALGLTQPLTKISTRNISCGVKAAGAYDWQPYHFHGPTVLKSGTRVGTVDALHYKPEGCGSDSRWCHRNFFFTNIIFSGCPLALGLTQPQLNLVQGIFRGGVKAAGAYDWQPYHFHGPTVLKSGRLCILEPSMPVQVCTGIFFFFYIFWPMSGHDQRYAATCSSI